MQALRCCKNVPIEMEICSHCSIRQKSRLPKCRYAVLLLSLKKKKQESKQKPIITYMHRKGLGWIYTKELMVVASQQIET